jgi:hypothetical protein
MAPRSARQRIVAGVARAQEENENDAARIVLRRGGGWLCRKSGGVVDAEAVLCSRAALSLPFLSQVLRYLKKRSLENAWFQGKLG